MRVPVLWIPLPPHFEEAMAGAPGRRNQRVAPVSHLSLDALIADARTIEPAAQAFSAQWQLRAASAAVPASLERYVEYDIYFHVRRRNDVAPLVALGEAAVVAYHRMVMNMREGSSLDSQRLAALYNAFAVIFALTSIAHPNGAAIRESIVDTTPEASVSPNDQAIDAMLRWRIGHHAFFVMIQALIEVHLRLSAALEQREWSEAQLALEQATQLWDGTAAAFCCTGDFAAEDYENIVRPSMSPPNQKEGFSGFFSSDHISMIQIMKTLRPTLLQLPSELLDAHQAYLQALDKAYEAHAFVCELFVGGGRSLRGGQLERNGSGPSFIRHALKRRTMVAAGYPTERQ